MPKTIRFHLDENCTKAIAVGLRRHGIEVTTTPEVDSSVQSTRSRRPTPGSRAGSSSPRTGTFSVFMRAGIPHAGIAYCEKDTRSIGEIIAALNPHLGSLRAERDEKAGRVYLGWI